MNIGSDNGLSPGQHQVIIWTNAGISLFGPLGTNFSEIIIKSHISSFKKMHLKMLSAKWRPFVSSSMSKPRWIQWKRVQTGDQYINLFCLLLCGVHCRRHWSLSSNIKSQSDFTLQWQSTDIVYSHHRDRDFNCYLKGFQLIIPKQNFCHM